MLFNFSQLLWSTTVTSLLCKSLFGLPAGMTSLETACSFREQRYFRIWFDLLYDMLAFMMQYCHKVIRKAILIDIFFKKGGKNIRIKWSCNKSRCSLSELACHKLLVSCYCSGTVLAQKMTVLSCGSSAVCAEAGNSATVATYKKACAGCVTATSLREWSYEFHSWTLYINLGKTASWNS